MFGLFNRNFALAYRDIPQITKHVGKGWQQRIQHKERKMKKRIGIMICGNFFTFTVYKITGATGNSFFIAEPQGIGATRCALTQEDLQKQLDADVPMLRLIAKERSSR